jgi:hypothetical protein
MNTKKFEKLMDLVINEDTAQARELFHEIVVEKSREIYESIMADDAEEDEAEEEDVTESSYMDDDMDEGMGGQVGRLLDEISAEESGMTEDDDALDIDIDSDDENGSEEMNHSDEEAEHEEIEDAVVRIEDKLDQLMAEFEEIMGSDEEAAGAEEEELGADEEEGAEDDLDEAREEEDDMDEDAVMENVNLQKVSVTHGDNGAQTKSTVAFNSGQSGMASKPVKFSNNAEASPTGPKGPSNAYSKGEGNLPGAGKFKNAPGHKSQDLSKTPAPVKKDAASGTKSPVAKK